MKRPVLAILLFSAASAAPESARRIVVVSDLHLSGDARDDEAFAGLLGEHGPAIDLVLAGDLFELDGDARGKLEAILTSHRAIVAALDIVSRAGSVHILPGDHDEALADENVSAVLLGRLPEARVVASGRFTSDDGRIVIEHGHRLPGSQHGPKLEELFDRVGSTYPVVEHFAERVMGLKYTADAGLPADVVERLLMTVSWQQFRRDLELDVEAPEWDLTAIRAMGDAFLETSFPEDDPLFGRWTRGVSELSDDEIGLLCNQRAAIRRARRRMERGLTQLARVGPVVAECPRRESTRGPSFSYYWSSRDERYRKHLAEIDGRPDLFIHGHTHLPDRGFSPGPDLNTPKILNTGAFLRTVTPAEIERRRDAESRSAFLRTMSRDELPTCYSFIRIEPYDGVPLAEQLYWYQDADGAWTSGRRCSH